MDVEEYGLAYIVMGNLHKLRQQRFIRILETDDVNVWGCGPEEG